MDKDLMYIYMRLHFIPSENARRLPATDKTGLIDDKEVALDILDDTLKKVIEDAVGEISGEWGAFLSGGIDSTLLCSYLRDIKPGFDVITIGSDGAIHDESCIAKKYAELLGVKQHIVMMNSSMAHEFISDINKSFTEPFADISIIPTYVASRYATTIGLNTCFSGDGGDELFYGYPRYWSVAKNRTFMGLPYFIRYFLYGFDKVLFKNKHLNDVLLSDSLSSAHCGLHSRVSKEMCEKLFIDGFCGQYPVWFDAFNYYNGESDIDLLISMREAEFQFMGEKGAKKLSLASKATGLHIVTPMMNPVFVKAALQVSPFLSCAGGRKKQLLKELLRRRVPGIEIDENKRGFLVPLSKWIREDLKDDFEQLLFDKSMLREFNIDEFELNRIWREHLEGKRDNKFALFNLYSLFCWKRNEKKQN